MSVGIELQEGMIFADEFRVIRKLGEGGMGALYVVEQIATGRQRALKLMHPTLVGSPELREKFMLEARVGGRVKSEHVIEVVAAGVDKTTGAPWLAMELLVGENLTEALDRRGPFSPEEMVAVLAQVCHALGAAHDAGIIHRDLKPDNIFLAETHRANQTFMVKLLDFGIAKLVEAARGTNTGGLGSPLWMAPEQTERSATITPATDVWALGLVAFRMLTNQSYWLAASQAELGLGAFLRELVLDDLPSASARAAELGITTPLPAGFDDWFAKCVTRGERYPDARTAFTALAAALGIDARTSLDDTSRKSFRDAHTGPQVRVSRDVDAVADAKTHLDTGKAVELVTDPPPPADVPVSGPSPRFVAMSVAIVVALGAVIGGAIFFTRKDTSEAQKSADATVVKEVFCPKGMARVVGGELKMGSESGPSEERPEHVVLVDSFCIDLTEVTSAEYDACVKKKGCPEPKPTADWQDIKKDEKEAWSVYCNAGHSDRREHPMNCVTFEEAVAYCRSQGKKLPTEEQWEYAARGAEGRAYPWGHESPRPTRLNGCDDGCPPVARKNAEATLGPRLIGDDGWPGTSPVGTFAEGVSPFGAFDMAGNVAEWVDAPFCPYGQTACGTVTRVVRGGSWSTEFPNGMRGAARSKAPPSARAPDIGFRCAK